MNSVQAIRTVATEGTSTSFDVIFAAQKDASEIAFLEGVLRTTMHATTDARTRREIRVKLDALNTMRTGTATVPNTLPVF